MSYPGNPSLADEIQKKILGTFLQTLDLAEAGKKEEALLGCEFIRRLDPLFEPAETLLERLEGQEGAVPVADLRSELEVPAAPSAVEPEEAEASAPEPDTLDQEVEALFSEGDSLDEPLEAPPGQALGAPPPRMPAAEPESDASILESALDLSSLDAEPEEETAKPEPEPQPEAAASAEPAAALDKESEERVEQLLTEGQAAFEEAEYQSAIDAWSRIFLIDIDHPEANRRIELARKLKAEVERKVEELYHDALAAMDGGSVELAMEGFRKVLKLQPNHLAAQEHFDRLTAGDEEPPEEIPEEDAPIDLAPLPESDTQLEDTFAEDIPESDFGFEPSEPSLDEEFDISESLELPRPEVSRRPSRRTLFVIAGLVLVVAVVAALFLRSNWTRFFPNAGEEVVAPQRPKVDPIVRAQGLHMGGNTAMAISQLRRLPPAHPKYAEAQALIAQWETVLEEDSDEGPSAEELAERDSYVALAREAFANRQFLSAEEYFTLASQAAPLDEGAEAVQAETIERLEPLRSEIEIFRQGEWAYALRSLWRKYEEDPGNPDILRLMVDGYYNLGVRDLQRGDPAAAIENLTEAASLAGQDAEIQRLLDFADAYRQRSPDLLYRIFVKYLPFR